MTISFLSNQFTADSNQTVPEELAPATTGKKKRVYEQNCSEFVLPGSLADRRSLRESPEKQYMNQFTVKPNNGAVGGDARSQQHAEEDAATQNVFLQTISSPSNPFNKTQVFGQNCFRFAINSDVVKQGFPLESPQKQYMSHLKVTSNTCPAEIDSSYQNHVQKDSAAQPAFLQTTPSAPSPAKMSISFLIN